MEYLQLRLKDVTYTSTDNQITAQVIMTLPDIYQDHKPVFNQRMKDTEKPLTLTKMKELLRTAWKQHEKTKEPAATDTAFVATGGNFKKQFKGRCSKFEGKCNYCGESPDIKKMSVARRKEMKHAERITTIIM